MSLQLIVKTLGGDLYDRGRRANIPAPGHSRADRSVSLLLTGGRVVVHTFGGGADWRAVLDHLRRLKLVDAAGAPRSRSGETAPPPASVVTPLERRAVALRLWAGGRAIAGTPSERYCRRRAVAGRLPGPDVLRHHPEAPVSAYRPDRFVRPALLAAIRTPAGDLAGVEVAYLTPQGRRATDLRLPRKTVGLAPAGCAVRLDPAAEAMLVGEGVFTTRSASAWFGRPGWALLSARNLGVWRPPPGVRSVLVASDRGRVGEAAAEMLRRRLCAGGLATAVALPPETYDDWNSWAAAVAADRPWEAGGRGLSGAP